MIVGSSSILSLVFALLTKLNLFNNLIIAIFASNFANLSPMQILGPWPNPAKAYLESKS